MDVGLDVVWLVVGLLLLVGGGEMLVRGAVSLSQAIGVSPLLIGLTVVAFGTSAPELAVNVVAAIDGKSGISFGNIIGSNIANIGLIIGTTAVVMPLSVHKSIIVREIPIMLLATAATVAMCLDTQTGLDGSDRISRTDGIILLSMFGMFMVYTAAEALRQRKKDPLIKELEEEVEETKPLPVLPAVLFTLLGLAGVIGGGDRTVEGAVGIAQAVGISDAVIGLTIVAIGTSLPELVTSLMAVLRGHSDIAVGNVVGSNIWNLLLILGVTSTVNPVDVPSDGGLFDLILVSAVSVLLLPIAMTGKRTISRFEGGIVLAIYIAYMSWRTLVELGVFPPLAL